jgi:hypothetical protein
MGPWAPVRVPDEAVGGSMRVVHEPLCIPSWDPMLPWAYWVGQVSDPTRPPHGRPWLREGMHTNP